MTMKKYKVKAYYTTYCYAEIEADNEDQAWQIAEDMDGGEFKQADTGDWEIDYVMEIKQ